MKLNLTSDRWAAVKPDAFLTGSIVQARNVIEIATQDIALLTADGDRTERNCDMWKGQCERQADQLRARQWQPIATAPKDGHDILITTAGHGMLVRVGFWDEARDGVWSVWPGRERMEPTHWQPLPVSPGSIDAPSALSSNQHITKEADRG